MGINIRLGCSPFRTCHFKLSRDCKLFSEADAEIIFSSDGGRLVSPLMEKVYKRAQSAIGWVAPLVPLAMERFGEESSAAKM